MLTVYCRGLLLGAAIVAVPGQLVALDPASLLRGGLRELLVAVENRSVPPPTISSSWRIRQCPDSDKTGGEEALAFGYQMLREMERFVGICTGDGFPCFYGERRTDEEVRSALRKSAQAVGGRRLSLLQAKEVAGGCPGRWALERAQVLLRVAAWLQEAEGYGNTLIAQRARVLAAVIIRYAVVDPEVGVAEAEAVLNRLKDARLPVGAKRRIMNTEGCGCGFEGATALELFREWRRLVREVDVGEFATLDEDGSGKPNLTVACSRFMNQQWLTHRVGVLSRWEAKQHKLIVTGLLERLVRSLVEQVHALLRFREEIGWIPLEANPPVDPFERIPDDSFLAAFQDAWRARGLPRYSTVPNTAWSTFYWLARGIVDDETQDRVVFCGSEMEPVDGGGLGF